MIDIKPLIYSGVIGLTVCLIGSNANADLVVAFSDNGGDSFIDEALVTPGESIRIDVFAREVGDTTTLSEQGLAAMGLRGTFDSSFGQVESVQVANFLLLPETTIDASGGSFNLAGGDPTFSGIKGTQIGLGSFSFVANRIGSSAISFADLSPGQGESDFTAGESPFDDLDPIFFSGGRTFSLTVTAVPEPGSVLAFSLFAVGGLVYRRRRIARPAN